MWATILSTCYASTESLDVSELNDANIKSFGVPGHIYPVQLNPPTSQQLCLLCRTSWRLNSRTNYRSEMLDARATAAGMSETGNRGLDAREHWRTPRLIRFAVTCETVTARDSAGPPSPDGPAAHIAHAINFHSPIFTQLFQRWRGSFFFSQNEALPASDGRPAPGPAASPHRHRLVTVGHRHTLPHFFF